MDTTERVMRAALAAKLQRRRELAALPYADKVRILLRLQHMADAIHATRGASPRAWLIDEDSLMPKASVRAVRVGRVRRFAPNPPSAKEAKVPSPFLGRGLG